jgi:hypothetical protein
MSFNPKDISTDLQTIWNNIIVRYNKIINKPVEPFTLKPLTKEEEKLFTMITLLGYDINFTAQELYDVMENLEFKASALTAQQRTNRKTIFTFIKNELKKFKDSGKLFILINTGSVDDVLSQLPLYGNSNSEGMITNTDSSSNTFTNVITTPPETKDNILATFTLFQNIIDLFLNEINDIENPKICPTCSTCPLVNDKKYIIIISVIGFLLLILLIALVLLIIKLKKKKITNINPAKSNKSTR